MTGDRRWMSRVRDPREVAPDEDLVAADDVRHRLADPPSLLVGGDVMLGGRSRRHLDEYGGAYPFQGVLPLLEACKLVCVNLEGPLAKEAEKLPRNHSYRVSPRHARTLQDANIGLVCLANNHLLDCGREGVLETMQTLRRRRVAWIGGGENEASAYEPYVYRDGPLTVGVLNYYWNRRTAARKRLPGSAQATPSNLRRDIGRLSSEVDRVVVLFHWGVPYEPSPSEEDRSYAHLAVDLGASAVVGHHPHVIWPLEVYRDRPIFYSVGNFAFGSGNSKGQGLLLGLTFDDRRTVVQVYPLYVKNRDPRVDYQPKLLCGRTADYFVAQLGAAFEPASLGYRKVFPSPVYEEVAA